MKISHEFEVHRPISDVWDMFQDIPSVAHCLPGADLTEDRGGGVYAGELQVKLGPMTAKFEGEAKVSPDEPARRATIEGKGVDRAGGSRGTVNVSYHLAETEGHTRVFVDADVKLSGAIAQFGRSGLVEEMSRRLIDEFVYCMHAKLDAATPEQAATIEAGEVKGLSLVLASFTAWLGKLFKRLLARVRQR